MENIQIVLTSPQILNTALYNNNISLVALGYFFKSLEITRQIHDNEQNSLQMLKLTDNKRTYDK